MGARGFRWPKSKLGIVPEWVSPDAMEAAAIPAEPSSPRLFAGAKARRAAKRAARLSSDADRFERAAARLETVVGAEAWQVRHLYRQAADLRRLASEEVAALAPAA
jgi:hypothetical protein